MALTGQGCKSTFRRAMKVVLKNLTPGEITRQSEQLTRILINCDFFQRSKAVSCYLSISGEIETDRLAVEVLRAGKTLFIPRISLDRKSMQMLRIYSEADLMAMRPTEPWGIREPNLTWQSRPREDAGAQGTALDVIFLPGVAFDESFARLGHGKGYYDRFLNGYHKNGVRSSTPLLVGLALHEQVVSQNSFPVEVHDWRVDHILTATGLNTRSQPSRSDIEEEDKDI